jgi:maleylacetate reductase
MRGSTCLREPAGGRESRVIVRWGLASLPGVLGELGVNRPLLVASERWADLGLDVRPAARWTEVPSERVADVAAHAGDGIVAVGGGSAIDLGKAASAEAGVPVVSVPTTYSGAEWTSFFGIRDPGRRMRGGGSGAQLGAVVYDPELTLSLPRSETVGTALNALAHCAEALYVEGHNAEADRHALTGARLIGEWLPLVVDAPGDVEERRKLLEGAMQAGMALGHSMLALGHAMAQALGGRYGLPHGAMNALTLPAALRFNAEVAPDAVRRFGQALGSDDPARRVEELARLGGFERLRDFGVPETDLPGVAAATVERAGAKANPRPASPGEVEELLRSIY